MPKKKRTFEWEEALRLVEAGESKVAIAQRYGVTPQAVSYAVKNLRGEIQR